MGKRKRQDRKPEAVNKVDGIVFGDVSQIGNFYGDVVHVHRAGVGAVPVVTPIEPPGTAPAELLVGRRDQAEELLAQWSPDVHHAANVVSVVAGMGGVGKTTLIRHVCGVAVQRNWFSGGAVLIDMHGYEPASDRVRAAGVFAPLLRALGAGGEEIPATEAEQAAAYHQVLGLLARQRRRVLLVLDNVSTVDQIRDLLPHQAAHQVAVTTRDSLPLPGTHTLELDVLPVEDACELLRRTLDDDPRVSEVPGAAERLVRLCGRLPLAVTIVGAVLAEETTLTVAELAAELDNAASRLATLEQGASAVGTAFDVSWQRLLTRDPATAGLLKLLPLNPGPGFSTDAAAALLGQAPAAVRSPLRALHHTHLLQRADTQWQLHDLIRLYVRDRAIPTRTNAEDEPAAAVTRLLEHYLHATTAAAQRMVHERAESIAWFTRERPTLLAAIPLAVAVGRPQIAVDLAESIVTNFVTERYELDTRIALIQQALGAAEQLDDPQRQAGVLRVLADLFRFGGRFPEAIATGRRALDLSRTTGDRADEAEALLALGVMLFDDQQFEEAVTTYRQALELCRSAGNLETESRVLGHLFVPLSRMRRHEEAISAVERGIAIARSRGDRSSEGSLLTNLGAAFANAGRAAEAFETLELAAEVCHSAGDQEFEAHAWDNLAILYAQLGKSGKLATAQRNALAIYRATGDTDSENALVVNIGVALTQMGGLPEGIATHQKAVALCRAAGDKKAEGEALFRLGSFLAGNLQVSAACTAHQKAVDIWREIGNRHREGIELAALARVLFKAGRRTAAERTAEEAIEALLDSADPTRAAATQEWIDALPPKEPKAPEPEGPTASTVVTENSPGGCGGCYTVLTLGAIPVVYTFDGPWWILAGWAVLVPFLQSIVMIRLPTEVVRNDATPEQMVRAFRAVKRLLFLGLTMVAVLPLVLGGLWWLLALCTVFAVIGVDGKGATVLLYTVIGGITAYYTWGTWWALLGLAIPIVGALSPTTRSARVTTRIEVA